MNPEFHFSNHLRKDIIPAARTIKNMLCDPEEFKEYAEWILGKMEDTVTAHVKSLDVPGMADKCSTYEDLEAYKPMAVPENFYDEIAEYCTVATAGISTEPERTIMCTVLFMEVSMQLLRGSVDFINTVCRQRAQVILRSTPKIMLP
jgi:hypothetical protein